ncbi:hypothetical protein EJB05_57227 [Eragrostis curvula]|uniref:Uncharacterized protein n=1 Tax=Eragrostis curvula TaxID=38414 RepID=A0A5J9SFD4_9POAL|nr:hypothetical protein EJB05_57227 [Eragrostis curvula]
MQAFSRCSVDRTPCSRSRSRQQLRVGADVEVVEVRKSRWLDSRERDCWRREDKLPLETYELPPYLAAKIAIRLQNSE